MTHYESELMAKCTRELEDGIYKDPLEKLRLMCFARGASGISELGRAFRRQDDDGSKGLAFNEFAKGLHESGMEFSEDDAAEIFNQ